METFNWFTALKVFFVFSLIFLVKDMFSHGRKILDDIKQTLATVHPHDPPSVQVNRPQTKSVETPPQPEKGVEQENQPPVVKKKPTAKKPLDVHEGILRAAGFAKREYGYNSYRLELESSELGSVYEIWGVDLKRALLASGAQVGDTIRAVLTGHVETSTMDDGETSTVKKKIWDITKIE